jgi:hypothetical protein
MPHGVGGFGPRLDARWASVGAWQLPDICMSNRRPRTWRERCKAAPLGCGLLRECLGGARPSGRARLPTALWELRGGRRIAPRGAPWPRPGRAAWGVGALCAGDPGLPTISPRGALGRSRGRRRRRKALRRDDSYLVDSASSHMLVSKIKPCMSKYKQLYSETANGSLNQLSFI